MDHVTRQAEAATLAPAAGPLVTSPIGCEEEHRNRVPIPPAERSHQMTTIEVDDLVRSTRAMIEIDPNTSATNLISGMIRQWNLPSHDFRRRALDYELIHNGNVVGANTSVASSGFRSGDTLQLRSPEAKDVWARAGHLLNRVEDNLRVEVRRQGHRIVKGVRDQVDDAVSDVVESATRPIRDLADQVAGIGEDAVGDLTVHVRQRVEAIKSRVLDEISTRLRGGRSSISFRSRLQARLDLRRLARTGVLGDHSLPLRKSIGKLAALGIEKTALAAVGGGIAVLGGAVAVGAIPPEPATTLPPSTVAPITTSTAAPPATSAPATAIRIVGPREVNAGETFTLSWEGLVGANDLAVRWTRQDGQIVSRVLPAETASHRMELPVDSPRQVEISVATWPTGAPIGSHTVTVNHPPELPDQLVRIDERAEDRIPITSRDPDGDPIELTIVSTIVGVALVEDQDEQTLEVDVAEIGGPVTFGVCVEAVDQGGLSDRAWITIEIRPVISAGDSLWAIARRGIEAERRILGDDTAPTTPEINDRMHELRLDHWITDPDLIDISDIVRRWPLLAPATERPDSC